MYISLTSAGPGVKTVIKKLAPFSHFSFHRWPQSTVPTFKIIQSDCLHKFQIGEQISLVRVKVSWPLSTREAVMHYYLFEYLQDDLIVVLINTVPESTSINGTLNGFKNEEIPEAKDAVRIDLVGGFALQKVTSERSYFRTIANMDIKLDFVPPSLINFISRQLIGNGFRLYQKAVASMMTQDKEFSKALGDPLYARIREALYDIIGSKRAMDGEELKQSANILPGEDLIGSKQNNAKDASQEDTIYLYADKSTPMNAMVPHSEIEEADSEEIEHFEEDGMKVNDIPMEEVDTRSLLKDKRDVYISSEVEKALETLEKTMSMVRKYRFHSRRSPSSFTNEESTHKKKGYTVDSSSPKPRLLCSKSEVNIDVSNKDTLEGRSQEAPWITSDIHNLRQTRTDSNLKEVNYNKVVPASPEQNRSRPNAASQGSVCSSKNGATDIPNRDQKICSNSESNTAVIQPVCSDEPKKSSMREKYKYCCFLPQLKRKIEVAKSKR